MALHSIGSHVAAEHVMSISFLPYGGAVHFDRNKRIPALTRKQTIRTNSIWVATSENPHTYLVHSDDGTFRTHVGWLGILREEQVRAQFRRTEFRQKSARVGTLGRCT